MKQLFISFKNSSDMNIARIVLADRGFSVSKIYQKHHYILEFNIEPEQEFLILETLDWYQIWVDTFDSFEEFLNS